MKPTWLKWIYDAADQLTKLLDQLAHRPEGKDAVRSIRLPEEFYDQSHQLRLDPRFLINHDLMHLCERMLPLQLENGRILAAVAAGTIPKLDEYDEDFTGLDYLEVPTTVYEAARWKYFGADRPGQEAPVKRAAATTFAVRSVTPGTQAYPERRLWDVCRSRFSADILAVSDFFTPVLDLQGRGCSHQLLNAVYLAFCDHRPLILSPDMIWVTLLQGLAKHFEIDAERLRPLMVSHEGKARLTVERPDFVLQSLENPWEQTFEAFSAQIRSHLHPEVAQLGAMHFSTTGPTERAAFAVALMDICKVYFHYEMNCICGIPSISLEGCAQDWKALRQAVYSWRKFDLDWWLEPLDAVLAEFEAASSGQVNLKFWNDIYQSHDSEDGYGGPVQKFSGWISRLIPYYDYNNQRNPHLTGGADEALLATKMGSSLSRASVNLNTSDGSSPIEYVAGLVGIQQLTPDLALRPKIGWLVHGEPLLLTADPWTNQVQKFRPEIRRQLS